MPALSIPNRILESSQPAAILDGGISMMRCFQHYPIPRIVVAWEGADLSTYSRHCNGLAMIPNPEKNPEGTINSLLKLGSLFSVPPVLFYGTDTMLSLISRNRDSLGQYYRILMPPPEVIEGLGSKSEFLRLAAAFNLPVPRTFRPKSPNDLDLVKHQLGFPCIIKPANKIGWFESPIIQRRGGRPHKMLIAENIGDLTAVFNELRPYCDDFVVQELIPGSDNNLYSYHSCTNSEGETLGHFIGRKLRTFPKHSGESACITLADAPDLIREGMNIAKHLGLKGLFKMDFKRHSGTGAWYLLEINARSTLWNHLGAASGINLPLLLYQELIGQSSPPQMQYRTDIKWVYFDYELRAYLDESKKESFLSWIKSLTRNVIFCEFEWKDPLPALTSILRWLGGRLSALRATKILSSNKAIHHLPPR